MENQKYLSPHYPNLIQGFGIVLVFIFLSMLTALLIGLGYLSGSVALIDFMEMLGYLLAAGGTLLLVIRTKAKGYGEIPVFRHRRARPGNHGVVLILTLLAIIVVDPLTNLIPMPEEIQKMFEEMFSKTVPAFFTAVIFAPVLEELIFRGIVLEGFLKNYSPVKAIVWTNVLFGLAHLNPWQFVGAFLVGLLISWVYYKTRNLVLPILMHLVNNLTSFLFLYLADGPLSEISLKNMFSSPSGYYAMVLGGLLLLALFFAFSSRIFPVGQPPAE